MCREQGYQQSTLKQSTMDYQTFQPHPDLQPVIKCYWTLEIPADRDAERQRIVPDGCIEMVFILGDDIKRFTTETEFIIQPRAMMLGQTTAPFYVQPTGYVNSFAVRFYPYGFANFVDMPIENLANKETPIREVFEEVTAQVLTEKIIHATDTQARIEIIEAFLIAQLRKKDTVDKIVKTTVDAIFSTKGQAPIGTLLQGDLSKRRQLERKFLKQIGISPKQLGKVIRLQAALSMLLNEKPEKLTDIAHDNAYYDQAHFIKDFKEFTGTNPKEFLKDKQMALSALFYTAE